MKEFNGKGIPKNRKTYRFASGAGFRCELLRDGRPCEGLLVQDVSGEGVGAWAERPLKKGVCLETRMFFPGEGEPVKAISKVVRCSKDRRGAFPYRIGIRHIEFYPEDQERFISLFCELMTQEDKNERL